MYKREQIEKAVKSKGYIWFEDSKNKGYDVLEITDFSSTNLIEKSELMPGQLVTVDAGASWNL